MGNAANGYICIYTYTYVFNSFAVKCPSVVTNRNGNITMSQLPQYKYKYKHYVIHTYMCYSTVPNNKKSLPSENYASTNVTVLYCLSISIRNRERKRGKVYLLPHYSREKINRNLKLSKLSELSKLYLYFQIFYHYFNILSLIQNDRYYRTCYKAYYYYFISIIIIIIIMELTIMEELNAPRKAHLILTSARNIYL